MQYDYNMIMTHCLLVLVLTNQIVAYHVLYKPFLKIFSFNKMFHLKHKFNVTNEDLLEHLEDDTRDVFRKIFKYNHLSFLIFR